jgi:glycerol-3-phosphate dehydrogenase subunit B
MTTLVIGGGFAGLAATWALTRRGRDVLLAWDGEGATSLYAGALDRRDWSQEPDARPLSADAEAFLFALGCFAPPGSVGARLATSAGVIRPARCRDRALLDLEPWRGRRIQVLDLGRPGWDAPNLARAWSESSWARQTRTEFRPLAVAAPDIEAARWLSASDLAARADDPEWAALLAAAIAAASPGEGPLLTGPWLGLQPDSVERLRAGLRRPLGETLSEPGGAAGLRYEAARDAWLAKSGVRVERVAVSSVARRGAHYEVLCQRPGDAKLTSLAGDIGEVILAIGGVAGGGVRFLAGAGPEGRSFSLSLDAPVALRLDGREVTIQSGALGADLQHLGLEALTLVGLSVDEQMLARAPDLYAVGDVVEGRPRCALEAIYTGLGAARAVCRVRAPSSSPRKGEEHGKDEY